MKRLLGVFALAFSLPVVAGSLQSHAEIHRRVEAFVQTQTSAIPGKVRTKVGDIDPRLALPACETLEVFLPSGNQWMGNSQVGVRCQESWSLFVPVQITISHTLLATSHPLRMGQTITTDDLTELTGEISQPGILSDPAQAIGKVVKFSLGAGQILKQDMLRAPWSVTLGQTVKLMVSMEGLTVTSEGQAMNNAAAGERVRVKTASGQMVSGTADENGTVRIRP